MRMSVKFSFVIFCLSIVTLLVAEPTVASSQLFDPTVKSYQWGQWQFAGSANYFSSQANYPSSGGEYVSLPSGNSYSLLQGDFGTRWVAMPGFAVQLSSQLAFAESKDQTDTRTNSSLTEINFGADYLLLQSKRLDLATELLFSVPLQRVDPQADDVLNHEGSLDIEILLSASYQLGVSHLFATSGFIYRDENRASLIPVRVGTEFKFRKWLLGADISGYFTALKDSRNNSLQREQVYANNGNSLRFFSADPSLIKASGWIGAQFGGDWLFKLGGGSSLSGAATAAGIEVFSLLVWSPDSSEKQAMPITPTRSVEETVEFKEDIKDGVDQKLFEEQPPVSNEPLQIKPPVKPPRPKPTQSPEAQKKRLQKELDQTEFQIELKSKQKKKKKKR